MNVEEFYRQLSKVTDSSDQERVVERYVSDGFLSKCAERSCEANGNVDCEIDDDKCFIIEVYVECDGHGEVKFGEGGDFQDEDGESYDIAEERGRVVLYLSPNHISGEFEAE